MAAIVAETRRRRTWLTSVKDAVVDIAARIIEPHKASLGNLRDIPLTVMGAGNIDFAAFHLPHGWGWLVTGFSLILLEHMIAEDR